MRLKKSSKNKSNFSPLGNDEPLCLSVERGRTLREEYGGNKQFEEGVWRNTSKGKLLEKRTRRGIKSEFNPFNYGIETLRTDEMTRV